MRRLYVLLLVAILSVATLAPPSGQAAASHLVVGSYSRVNSTFLRLRTGPGYDYATIMQMPKGAVVKVVSGPHNSTWHKVSYRGYTGYSYSHYLTHTGLAGADMARYYYKVVVVSLARQQVEVYQNGSLVLVSAATTGRP